MQIAKAFEARNPSPTHGNVGVGVGYVLRLTWNWLTLDWKCGSGSGTCVNTTGLFCCTSEANGYLDVREEGTDRRTCSFSPTEAG